MGCTTKNVSVIVPAYNVERYISTCLDSIAAQGDCVLEIIVVDDGSNDNTSAICGKYAQKYDIIKVIHQNNQGCASARNAGLDFAKGEYIAFVDGDDFLRPNMYNILLEALVGNNADMAVCNYDKVSEDGKTIICYTNTARNEIVSGREALRWLSRNHNWTYVVAWNKLYRREVFADVRFPAGKIFEDEFVFHKVCLNCKRIVSVTDSLYCYRYNSNSITSSSVPIQRIDGFEAIYNRFNAFENLGYKELLRMTVDNARGKLSIINKCVVSSEDDRNRIQLMIRHFREMVRKTGKEAGLLNHIIAVSPRMYYWVRGIIKGR